jgi:hypothetical protein
VLIGIVNYVGCSSSDSGTTPPAGAGGTGGAGGAGGSDSGGGSGGSDGSTGDAVVDAPDLDAPAADAAGQ